MDFLDSLIAERLGGKMFGKIENPLESIIHSIGSKPALSLLLLSKIMLILVNLELFKKLAFMHLIISPYFKQIEIDIPEG